MQLPVKIIKGVFVEELKNRFLCSVLINNILVECYVPSSCRLGNFLELSGKQVLVVPTQSSKARTRCALLAIPYKKSYILLNTGLSNRIIEDSLKRRYFSFMRKRNEVIREYSIDGYKSDLYVKDSDTLIEIKSVISLNRVADFPTVFSERSLMQLNQIYKLLCKGHHAVFVITSLNPYVKEIHMDRDSKLYETMQPCLEKGMQLMAFSIGFSKEEIKIKSKLPIT